MQSSQEALWGQASGGGPPGPTCPAPDNHHLPTNHCLGPIPLNWQMYPRGSEK